MITDISELVRELREYAPYVPVPDLNGTADVLERLAAEHARISERIAVVQGDLDRESKEAESYHALWIEERSKRILAENERDDWKKRHDTVLQTDDAARAEKFAAQLVQLQKGIQDYLDGNYGRAQYFKSKNDKCPHGLFDWEACENCIDAHFSRLLAAVSSPVTEKTDG